MKLRLVILDGGLAVCRLAADAPIPAWATGEVVSVTRTGEELSVICEEQAVPEDVTAERGWRCLKVVGPLSFELTGILAALSGTLAEAAVPIFALSTYDTDYLLVKDDDLASAIAALKRAGHLVDAP